ncbi:MAG: peptide-binding protein [Desulfovibrionaceae bacterium]|nr:peptide-binding protein [Desulfovibrionaceae bacterium]
MAFSQSLHRITAENGGLAACSLTRFRRFPMRIPLLLCYLLFCLIRPCTAGLLADSIVMGSIGEPSNLIPYLSSDSASHEIADLLYIAPLRYDKNLRIEPYAAQSYEILDEGRRIRFRLRDGLLWEDGQPLTADDVEFTYRLMIDPRTPTPYADDFLAVSEFRKIDRLTFEVVYNTVYARALQTWMQAILPKHCLEGQDIRTTRFARNPVGAGPFRLREWNSGSALRLEASPTYFQGRPRINTVVYRIIPDGATMFLELRARNLDLMNLSPRQALRQTTGSFWEKAFQKYEYLSSVYTFLGFNMTHPFFQDVRIRRALSMAISRQDIIDGVLMGKGIAANGPYKPGSEFYNNGIAPVSQNIAEARRLLEECGWHDTDHDGILDRDGHPFSFTILTNQGNEQRILTAVIIQNQWKKIGVSVKIRTVEWAAFIRDFINEGRFDAVILGWTIGQDPDLYSVWHSSAARKGGLNFTRYTNPEIDTLLEQGRSVFSAQQRKLLYDRFQEILNEEQPYCFLYVPLALPIVSSRFSNIEPAPAGIMHNFTEWDPAPQLHP